MGETILYLVFVSGLLGASTGVVLVKTPIHSLILLVMALFNIAGLFLVWGAEFLAMILVVVYVGAVAVLFLFIVMMLEINQDSSRFKFSSYTGFSALIAFLLFCEMIIAILPWKTWEKATDVIALPICQEMTNAQQIGSYLYTQYFYAFQVSGVLLLVAMIGAILLTLRDRGDINRQNVSKQINRKPSDTLIFVNAPFEQGVDI